MIRDIMHNEISHCLWELMHFFILLSKCDNNGFSMYYETEMYNIEQTNRGRKFYFIINGFVCVTIDYIYVPCCSALSVLQLTTYMFRVAQSLVF